MEREGGERDVFPQVGPNRRAISGTTAYEQFTSTGESMTGDDDARGAVADFGIRQRRGRQFDPHN